MSEVILKVDHLKKYFPVKAKMFSGSKGTVYAVDDVSFEIRKGETFGLVGESGCGKSTLSRTIIDSAYFPGADFRRGGKTQAKIFATPDMVRSGR